VYSGRNKISLHQGSLIALQEHADGVYPGMRICFASSADTPFAEKVGRATLKLLEVVPGMTVWDLAIRDWDNKDVNQIGRQPPLSRYETLEKSSPLDDICFVVFSISKLTFLLPEMKQ
jgi:hypothetical protein